jgi:hypothetical protein
MLHLVVRELSNSPMVESITAAIPHRQTTHRQQTHDLLPEP